MKFILITFFFLLLISIFFSIGSSSDTISTGQSLFPNQTIVSRQGKFELGFFTPGNSGKLYVGIWYKSISEPTVVWVGNRDNPIPPSNYDVSRLEMSNGILYLNINSVTISLSGIITSNATEAVILDTGNLVLRNASSIIWQSFDNPTDTWLPGGRIGYRRFSNTEYKLVSWKNPNDPAPGVYSFGMEPNRGDELFITCRTRRLWRSAALQDRTFAPFFRLYNFTGVRTDDTVYVTFTVNDESMLSRFQIDHVGRLMHFVWSEADGDWDLYRAQPSDACKSYNVCGPNAVCDIRSTPICSCMDGFLPRVRQEWESNVYSSGCVRKRLLECSEEKTEYVEVNNMRLPANPVSVRGTGRSRACETLCSEKCSCNGYVYDSVRGCLIFTGDLVDLERLSNGSVGADLYVRVESDLPGKGKRIVLPFAIVLAITVGILMSCFCLHYLWAKLKTKDSPEAHRNLLLLDLNSNGPAYNKQASVGDRNGDEKNNQYELPIFSFSSIALSTNSFSITNKIGEGGFGPVYKGELLNAQFVAVKRLSRWSGQGLEEFKNEIELIAKLQHRNLVGILGCCIENDEKILVYEYMPNKSLDFFLFEPTEKKLLDWKRRVHIIEGIAQGLLYLHHYSRLRIVHRDLKASNILLDAEMNPKISDFGMARICGENDSQANTKRIVGTYGYMSPEYAMEGLFSVKSDVFAFGVLLLEIISGKKNTGFYGSDYLSLLRYAWHMWKHGRVFEIVDPVLDISSTSSSTPVRYIQIGLLCVQDSPADRPLMSHVVAMLNNVQTAIASPQHPAFTVGRTLAKASPGQGKVEICSVNGLTVSQMEAR